jgi:hypothetical protein
MTADEDAFRSEVHICGFPKDRHFGDWIRGEFAGPTGEGWLQMDHALTSKLVKPGFSGAPAWVDGKRCAAGLVVQRFWKDGESSAYVAPVKKLLKVFPGLRTAPDDLPSDSPSVSRSVNVRGNVAGSVLVTGNDNTINATNGLNPTGPQTTHTTPNPTEPETIHMDAFISIPSGTYHLSMGEVEIDTPFEIGKYPVTNGWFRETPWKSSSKPPTPDKKPNFSPRPISGWSASATSFASARTSNSSTSKPTKPPPNPSTPWAFPWAGGSGIPRPVLRLILRNL